MGPKPIMKFFEYQHLPETLQAASKPFCDLAQHIHDNMPSSDEQDVCLRKLLEAKDAGVRAAMMA